MDRRARGMSTYLLLMAVLMLFLFVIMVVGVSSTESMVETIKGQRVAAAIAAIGFGVLALFAVAGAAILTVLGITLPAAGRYGAGLVFLPRKAEELAALRGA